MPAVLLPNGKQQFFTTPGVPAVGYKLATFAAGTSSNQTTWADAGKISANTNPIILDARGEAVIFWDGNYKVQLQDTTGAVIWTVDNIAPITATLIANYSADSGAVNAYVAAGGLAAAAYTTGLTVTFKVATTNTGPSTMNYGGLGARNIFLDGHALSGGELQANVIYEMEYDGSQFQLLNYTDPSRVRTAAEIAAGVTPTRFNYAPYPIDPRRYGAIGDGVTDDTAAFQTALNVAAATIVALLRGGGTVKIYDGLNYRCTANINVPVSTSNFANGYSVNIEGSGWTNFGITFDGAAVTTGLTYAGSVFNWVGSIRNVAITCKNGAISHVTATNVTKPLISECWLNGAAGRSIYFNTTIMGRIEKCLLTNSGAPSLGMVEVDQSTTFHWEQSYISSGAAGCFAGLVIDRTAQININGGAIESCGPPILISAKISTAVGCSSVNIRGIDLENPGNGNRYIDIGGLLSAGQVSTVIIDGISGFSSGTTNQPSGVRLQNCVGAEIRASNFGLLGANGACTITIANPAVFTFANTFSANQPVVFTTTGALPTGLTPGTTYFVSASGLSASSFQVSATAGGGSIVTTGSQSGVHTVSATVASYEIAGAGNLRTHILPHGTLFGGNPYPWVTVNGAQVKAASPLYDWVQGDSPKGFVAVGSSISGANPSILVLLGQGGYYAAITMANGGATTVATLTGGESGMQIVIVANDNNTTLTQGIGAGQFSLLGGANLALVQSKSYAFIHNGTCWIQH